MKWIFCMALSSFERFKYLIPSFSFKLNGFELSFNYETQNAKGSTYVYFLIELFDISLLRFSTERRVTQTIGESQEKFKSAASFTILTKTFAFLGFHRVVRPCQGNGVIKRWELDTRLIGLLLLLFLLWLVKSYAIVTSGYLTLIMPALYSPVLQLSLLEVLTSLRAFIALLQIQLSLANIVSYLGSSNTFDVTPTSLIMPFFHYRVTLFFAITPALMFGFHPVAFVMLSSAIISTLDVLFSYKSALHFSWLACIRINLLRFKLRDVASLTKVHLLDLCVFSYSFKRDSLVNRVEAFSNDMNPKTDLNIYNSHAL